MHLHDHFAATRLGVQHLLHFDHAQLNEIGRRALHGRVDGGSLGATAARTIGRVDLRQVKTSAEHRLDIAEALG